VPEHQSPAESSGFAAVVRKSFSEISPGRSCKTPLAGTRNHDEAVGSVRQEESLQAALPVRKADHQMTIGNNSRSAAFEAEEQGRQSPLADSIQRDARHPLS
jgi:hypothetical protein